MNMAQRTEIERVYQLLETYGPATAFDYMERAGGVLTFPLSLMMDVRLRLETNQRRARRRRMAETTGARSRSSRSAA